MTEGRLPRQRIVIWLGVFFALALATWGRIWIMDNLRDQGFFAKYVTFADQILAGDTPRHRVGDVSPAYLWFTVALRGVGLGFEGIRNLQIVMLSAAALFCAMAARRLGGWVAAAATALLILGNRSVLIVGAEIEPEALIFILTSAAILAVVRRNWLAAGFLIGLSATARPTALLTLILIAAWALLESRRAAMTVLATAAPPIALVMIVNASLTGNLFIMQPGSQLFEANNALATGCAGVFPQIVADIQRTSSEPDYLHVAYRVIAAKATGNPVDAKLSNRYWRDKAIGFMTNYPLAAAELFAWKALLTVHHYDVYDLVTTKRKSIELARYPAIPFGVAFVLTVVAFALRPNRRELLPVAIFAVATVVALVAFNVSTRQRSALFPTLAILGGAGVSELARLARARSEKALFAFGGIMIAIPLLGIEGKPMREDWYNWWAHLRATDLRREAFRARDKGDRARAIELAAVSSVLDTAQTPLVSRPMLARAAIHALGRLDSPPRLFDVAVALEKAGAWREAEAVLASIEDYRPRRENRAVSSVAYYRARAALRLGAPRMTFATHIDRAIAEAPGDPNVLALRTLTVDPAARQTLDELYDPFTRDLALATAYADLGDRKSAAALLTALTQSFPEWQRPRAALAEL